MFINFSLNNKYLCIDNCYNIDFLDVPMEFPFTFNNDGTISIIVNGKYLCSSPDSEILFSLNNKMVSTYE